MSTDNHAESSQQQEQEKRQSILKGRQKAEVHVYVTRAYNFWPDLIAAVGKMVMQHHVIYAMQLPQACMLVILCLVVVNLCLAMPQEECCMQLQAYLPSS